MLKLENIEKIYKNFHLKDISFEINKGEIVSLIGPSGSGKSTIVKIILGIVKPDKGKVLYDNRDITNYPSEMRNFGYIPQSIGLFSHLNSIGNIEFPLKVRKIKKQEREKVVASVLKEFEIADISKRYPKNLSGGEKQKIALARALIFHPYIILMDEPMNSIDYQIREKYLKFIKNINRKYGTPIIYITHNFEEAMVVSDKIIVLKEGKIVKKGVINDFIKNPDNIWIASFFKHKNIIYGYLKNRELTVENSNLKIKTSLEGEGNIFIMIRSDEIIISKEKIMSSALNCLKGKIKEYIPSLYNKELTIDIEGVEFKVLITEESFETLGLTNGLEVYLSFKANSVKKLKG